MSLMTIECLEGHAAAPIRLAVREIFAEANAILFQDTGATERLSRLAEMLLPSGLLKELEGLLPAPSLAFGRWMSGGAHPRSLIVSLAYRDRDCSRRRHAAVVVSDAKHINGILVSGKALRSYPLPHYVDELRAQLSAIISEFAAGSTQQ